MLTIIEPRPDTLLPGRPIYTERIPAGFHLLQLDMKSRI